MLRYAHETDDMGLAGRYRIALCGDGSEIDAVIDRADRLDTARSLYSRAVMNHPSRLERRAIELALSPGAITPKRCRSKLAGNLLSRDEARA